MPPFILIPLVIFASIGLAVTGLFFRRFATLPFRMVGWIIRLPFRLVGLFLRGGIWLVKSCAMLFVTGYMLITGRGLKVYSIPLSHSS